MRKKADGKFLPSDVFLHHICINLSGNVDHALKVLIPVLVDKLGVCFQAFSLSLRLICDLSPGICKSSSGSWLFPIPANRQILVTVGWASWVKKINGISSFI